LGEDYRIIQAENGLTGISAAIEWIPDIIVSDIMMPEMDGIALTKTLKEDIRTSHIPIILLTAKDSLDDKEEGYESGADSYLTKPFTTKLLHSRIQNLLNNRRRLTELMMLRNMAGEPQNGSESEETAAIEADTPVLSHLDQEFMDKMNRIIEDNMQKVDLDIAFITDKIAMSHSTFYRKVKALTGMTANEYIRKMKLRRSMALLQSGEYNVTEAAMMAGFNNLGHFRDSFKKEFGVNPSYVLKK
jgi:DNA-binding response OmpR family regulator